MSSNLVKRVLLLGANPQGSSKLRLDQEARAIDEVLRASGKRAQFRFLQRWAVRPMDITQALLEYKPQILHFCGHGAGEGGLAFEDETGGVRLVSTEALTSLFKICVEHLDCVILNACYSEIQANAISQYIDYVIGMGQAIGDRAAIKFAEGFYMALGAGQSIDLAFQTGCIAVQLYGAKSEQLTPMIKKNTAALLMNTYNNSLTRFADLLVKKDQGGKKLSMSC